MSTATDQRRDDPFASLRRKMVESQLQRRDVTDERVLQAMRTVPRHRFVPAESQQHAYEDRPLPIGHDQTISQPYIVALMTQLARAGPGRQALDVGSGSGYQAAVLAELCDRVYAMEIIKPLAEAACQRLGQLGYDNIEIRCGDAFNGWPEHAPFDVIIAAAAPRQVPRALVQQLAMGGRLVLPVGGRGSQQLIVMERRAANDVRRWGAGGVSFVPMTGEVLKRYR